MILGLIKVLTLLVIQKKLSFIKESKLTIMKLKNLKKKIKNLKKKIKN